MQHIFIINPTAGKVDASVALIPQIHAAASRAGLRPTIEVTRRAGQARDLAAQYAAGGEEVYLYACGRRRHAERNIAGYRRPPERCYRLRALRQRQ